MADIRYRCESYGGNERDPDTRKAAKVLAYEIGILGNEGIIDYISSHFGKEIDKDLRNKMDDFAAEAFDDEDDAIAAGEPIFKRVLRAIGEPRGKELEYALWLADEEDVKEMYAINDDDEIDAYETSGIVLCDLGPDGALYAYETMPKPIGDGKGG